MKLRVEVPRKITARGQNAVAYASAYLIGAAIAVLIVLMIVLNRVVLEPLARVTRHAVAIGEGTDLTARLNLPGRDEVARLAHEFDRMVASVAETRSANWSINPFKPASPSSPRACLHNLGQCHDAFGRAIGEALANACATRPRPTWNWPAANSPTREAGSARRADLEEFLRLGCREMAAIVADAQADVARDSAPGRHRAIGVDAN